jgi:predicted translin family RNA/ssDNA-binding protein
MRHEERVGGLIRVASRLIDVMRREIEMLRDMRTGGLDELQVQKNELTDAYEQQVRALAGEPEALTAVAPALRQEFAEVASLFNKVLAENESALNATRFAHERLIKAVVDAVAERRDAHNGYSANGAPARRVRGNRGKSEPLTLDRRL